MTPRDLVPIRELVGFTHPDYLMINGQRVVEGTEVHIDGLRGRWRVEALTVTPKATYIDVFSDRLGRGRVVGPDRVKTVHRRKT